MNREAAGKSSDGGSFPNPDTKKMRRPILLIWLVPIFAAIIAGYYFYDYLQGRGLTITLTFSDATGLVAGQSPIMHLGVGIGQVSDIRLSPDQTHAEVRVRLQRAAKSFASNGATFWIVRPEISAESISGLGTVLSGPFIDSIPGNGQPQTEFTGLDKAPATLEEGLRVVLKTPRMDHLQSGASVYFRGIEVGLIEDIKLSADSTGVDVHTFIRHRYSSLVRSNSQFWIISAVDVRGGLLSGVQMKVGSLPSLLSGGIAFATPDKNIGEPAQNGATFGLYDEPKKDWLDWAPVIPIQPEDTDDVQNPTTLPQSSQDIRSLVPH